MIIRKITVLQRPGFTDEIMLETDLPSPFPQMQYAANLKMATVKGLGIKYAQNNFPGITIEVIDVGSGKRYTLEQN